MSNNNIRILLLAEKSI